MEAEGHGYTRVAESPSKAVCKSLCNNLCWSSPCCFCLSFGFSSSLVLFTCLFFTFLSSGACGLGSIDTLAVSYDGNGGGSVCGIMQGNVQSLQCWNSNVSAVNVLPLQASFLGVSGGDGFVCGLRSDTGRPLCWNTQDLSSPRRLKNQPYSDIVAGTSHVCALSQASTATSNGSFATCWRNKNIESATPSLQAFTSLAAGANFVCGIKSPEGTLQCWGDSVVGNPPNATFISVQAGSRHACGLTRSSNAMCWGDNTYNQLAVPDGRQFLSLALGEQHSCGIDAFTRNVVCWGSSSLSRTSPPTSRSFSSIAAGDSFTCGILSSNSLVMCWGLSFGNGTLLPLKAVIPSACSSVACASGSFQQSSANISSRVCATSQFHVCVPCRIGCQSSFLQTALCTTDHDITCERTSVLQPVSAPPSPTTVLVVINRNRLSKGLIVLIALGALGSLCGLLTAGWCVWAKCCGPIGFSFDGSQGRVHNSSIGSVGVLPTIPAANRASMRRQRSSTSSIRSRLDITTGRAQAFTIADMVVATMGFSDENVIASGSFGIVYRGMLADGREVAIKRRERETVANEKKMEEKESAFQSELEFLSRLHHKHLVSLVGFCDEEDERMLVYDFMPNGTLHDHLHGSSKLKGEMGTLPWQMRIKIGLEAARGVEYLHTYALPPIIHRDIKSSNILLDRGWNARVSDFGLSTRGPAENSHLSLMAAGTLGYMDPEYYRLQHLTIKSDVYSFGVVLLELLTGERAIHKQSYGPVNIVDYAVPRIVSHDLASVLDQRPGAPTANELKGIEMVAQLATQCVRLEGKERPTMTDIVAVLEEAMMYTSNGRSRSQSSTIASLSGMAFDASMTRVKQSEEATDMAGAPFEFVQVEGAPFESVEAEVRTVKVSPTESSAFVLASNGEHAGSVELNIVDAASNEEGEDLAGKPYDKGGGEGLGRPFQVLHRTSSDMPSSEFAEAISYSTYYGGSGDAGSSETTEAFSITGGSNVVEPTKPHKA